MSSLPRHERVRLSDEGSRLLLHLDSPKAPSAPSDFAGGGGGGGGTPAGAAAEGLGYDAPSRTSAGGAGGGDEPAEADGVPRHWRLPKGETLLGKGSFGKVYKAVDLETGRLLAVKQVPASAVKGDSQDLLEREIDLMRAMRHPNIVQYVGTERSDEHLYIFLELVPGGSISHMLREFGPFDESVVATYTRHVLEGLRYLHDKRIIHRDIKGANILVDERGVAKLADFGCSKQLDMTGTRSSLDASLREIRGTVPFMAPEVIRQEGHGRKADIWSVGATVVEMASGSPPWSEFSNQLGLLFHVGTSGKTPTIPPHLSATAKDFLSLCFKFDPAERPGAEELLKHEFVARKDGATGRWGSRRSWAAWRMMAGRV